MESKQIRDAVYELPSPHREVLILSYGFEDGVEINVQQICKRLILTRDELRRIRKEAIEKLKEKLAD